MDEQESEFEISQNQVISKNGLEKYHKHPFEVRGRFGAHNVINSPQGFRNSPVYAASTPKQALNAFITPSMIEKIVCNTNQYIDEKNLTISYVTDVEIELFFGVMLLIGLLKGKNAKLSEYFTEEYGISIIYKSISFDRVKKILRVIRFDNPTIRNRKDKIAPIRDIFEDFIKNCQKAYSPSESVTIDEQLVTFRGRCSFRMYIPSKPGRYGIKIWALCDSKNAYLYNAKIYAGKEGNVTEVNQGENVVKTLMMPLYKTGRNVTTDNFFTSLNLARFLLTQKLTIVGTVRKNKTFLPLSFQSPKGDQGNVEFLFQKDHMLVKMNPKKNKSVVLLSSQHSSPTIDDDTSKPEIITYYNSTKAGVDTLDQVVRYYSSKRATKRWPLAIFFNLLDTAAYNACLLYIDRHPQFKLKYKNETRREFLKALCIELLNKEEVNIRPAKMIKTQGRCHCCPRSIDRKSRFMCQDCNKFVCKDHRVEICIKCSNK